MGPGFKSVPFYISGDGLRGEGLADRPVDGRLLHGHVPAGRDDALRPGDTPPGGPPLLRGHGDGGALERLHGRCRGGGRAGGPGGSARHGPPAAVPGLARRTRVSGESFVEYVFKSFIRHDLNLIFLSFIF